VNHKGAEKPQVREFVKFYLRNASSLASEVGLVPLKAEFYEAEEKKFHGFVSQEPSK
jgi:phosphate transport system substrate-binding protein